MRRILSGSECPLLTISSLLLLSPLIVCLLSSFCPLFGLPRGSFFPRSPPLSPPSRLLPSWLHLSALRSLASPLALSTCPLTSLRLLPSPFSLLMSPHLTFPHSTSAHSHLPSSGILPLQRRSRSFNLGPSPPGHCKIITDRSTGAVCAQPADPGTQGVMCHVRESPLSSLSSLLSLPIVTAS